MHLGDDHHPGMMGYVTEKHGDKKDMGRQAGLSQPADMLDKNLRTDSQGGIIIELQFEELTEKGELAFVVKVNNHMIGTNPYELDDLAFLANNEGTQVRASRWQSITLTPQHVSGNLYFPAQDGAGRALFTHETRNVSLSIRDLAGVSERVFQWNLAGH